MTLRGSLARLFPLFQSLLILANLYYLISTAQIIFLIGVILSIYTVPVVIFRFCNLFSPLHSSVHNLSSKKYNPWWTSHMLQYLFIAIPWLESLLHFIPGLFSFWLRCWGAKIGRNVYWTPRTEIVDRSLISIGDNCIIGHQSVFVSHLVEIKNGTPLLIIKSIYIGSNCMIGADAQIGPGAKIENNTNLKVKTRLYWRGEWK